MGTYCRRNYCHLRRIIAAATHPPPHHHLCFVICIIFISVFNPVESTGGSFEVRFHRFVNTFVPGRDSGGCCGGTVTSAPTSLLDTTARLNSTTACQCPVSFRVCVKNYQASVDSAPPCVIGEYVTPIFSAERLSKPLLDEKPIVFHFNFTWPGSFSFVIEAFHQSEMNGERILVSRFVAQRSIGTMQEWTKEILKSSNQSNQLEIYYRVRCEANYFGERCTTLCKPRDDKFGHYTCRADDGNIVCTPGWMGKYCSTPVCRAGCHTINGHCSQPYECKCRSGWEGELCDTCSRYPGCEHGTCKEPWQCNCDEGWGGLFCNQDLNYCTNHRPCKNSGICTNTGQGSYTCTCTAEYMGTDCDVLKNPCQENPCQNGGTCVNPSSGNFTCQCRLGFYGPKCETSASICTENPCKNGGTCIDGVGGFSCTCTSGFHGYQCEKTNANCSDFCLNGGQCVSESGKPSCMCLPEYIGNRCEEILSCKNKICQNGGHCYEQSNSSRCLCMPGFSGTLCEIPMESCAQSPCRNGAQCVNLSPGYKCLCKLGFIGIDCSEKDPCIPSPCFNGGLCKPEKKGPNYFSCHCPTGYVGNICQYISQDRDSLVRTVVRIEKVHHPTVSNISHHVMVENSASEEKSISSQIAIILSCSVVAVAAVTSCAIVLVVRFCCSRRREPKRCEETPEVDELKQNECNTMKMNNNCAVPQKKITNILDKTPKNVTNGGAPAKVLNASISNSKKTLEKNLLYAQRTFEKREISSASNNSAHRLSHDWSPNNNGGVFIIQDHMCQTSNLKFSENYQSRPPSLLLVEDENIFATEV